MAEHLAALGTLLAHGWTAFSLTVHLRYAGRTPTPADYAAARADPADVALGLIRADLQRRAG